MKTPLRTEVLGPGHIVLDGVPALRERGTAAPSFPSMSTVATVSHLGHCRARFDVSLYHISHRIGKRLNVGCSLFEEFFTVLLH